MFFDRMGRVAALPMFVAAGAFAGACDFTQATTAPPTGMGQEVRDGKFGFTVTQVNNSPTFGDTRAQGVYVIVSMTVKKVGTERWDVEWHTQALRDSVGREYSPSFMDLSEVGDNPDSYAVEPKREVRVKLAFDVLPDVKPTQIVVHDSASSHGVPVNLTQPAPSPPRG
jgi:Domain of unknown function (DUF4352)